MGARVIEWFLLNERIEHHTHIMSNRLMNYGTIYNYVPSQSFPSIRSHRSFEYTVIQDDFNTVYVHKKENYVMPTLSIRTPVDAVGKVAYCPWLWLVRMVPSGSYLGTYVSFIINS